MSYPQTVARDQRVTAGAVCLILTAVFFPGQFIAQAAVTKPYSVITNYISDLGATTCEPFSFGTFHVSVCSPLHTVMNVTFMLTGVFLIAGTVLLWGARPRGAIGTWAWVLLLIGGVGKIVAGTSPENLSPLSHSAGGAAVPCWTVAILLVGIALRRSRPRFMAWSVAAFALSMVGVVLMNAIEQVGLAERFAAYPLVIWTAAAGVVLLRSGRRVLER